MQDVTGGQLRGASVLAPRALRETHPAERHLQSPRGAGATPSPSASSGIQEQVVRSSKPSTQPQQASGPLLCTCAHVPMGHTVRGPELNVLECQVDNPATSTRKCARRHSPSGKQNHGHTEMPLHTRRMATDTHRPRRSTVGTWRGRTPRAPPPGMPGTRPPRRMARWLFNRLNGQLPYDPAPPLLGLRPGPREANVGSDTCVPTLAQAPGDG